jgi:hypothetical protein
LTTFLVKSLFLEIREANEQIRNGWRHNFCWIAVSDAMNADITTRISLRVSYVLFFLLLASYLFFVHRLAANKGEISFVPITALFSAVFSWQILTLSRNRHSVISWILVILYAIAIGVCAWEMTRFPSARQLW